jgi:hypothetical protein
VGTRGFIGFIIDGQEKITYNHFDSYPSRLGMTTLEWLRSADVNEVAEQVRALRLISQDDPVPPEDIERLRKFTDLMVGNQSTSDWYCLLRGTQGDPSAILEAGVMIDSHEFPSNSLLAEYGYVVDLDESRFEVYRGFQQAPHQLGRFATREVRPYSSGQVYYPCALTVSWPLSDLPSEQEFEEALAEPDEEEDE